MKRIINNIPNLITITRIVSSVMGAILFLSGSIVPAISLYVYGALSDAVDGYIARKYDMVSTIGKKLDAFSDKVYALSLTMPSIILGNYFMVFPLINEIVISCINVYSFSKYHSTYTEKIGKVKTIFLFPTLIFGIGATKITELFFLFFPTLFSTLHLQIKTIDAYMKQIDNFKHGNKSSLEVKKENSDFERYNDNIIIGNSKVDTKVKKLVRKRDYNDRY